MHSMQRMVQTIRVVPHQAWCHQTMRTSSSIVKPVRQLVGVASRRDPPVLQHTGVRWPGGSPQFRSGGGPMVSHSPIRCLASRRSKGGKRSGSNSGGLSKSSQVLKTVSHLPVDLNPVVHSMTAAVSQLEKELATIRAGELLPTVLDHLKVEMDGSDVPLVAVAQAAKKDSRTLIVTVFDPSMAGKVEATIRGSGLGFEPARDGAQIRVQAPRMTSELRQDLVKLAKENLERSKVRIRRVRADAIKTCKAADGVGKDDVSRLEDAVASLAGAAINDLDARFDAKRKEIEGSK